MFDFFSTSFFLLKFRYGELAKEKKRTLKNNSLFILLLFIERINNPI